MEMTGAVQAIIALFSGATLLMVVLEKVFGGGHNLASRFAKLDKDTGERISALERAVNAKVDQYEDNYAVGLDAIRANIHAMQLGLLEFRAKMAEEYINKRDYNAGITDIRRDVHTGFDEIKKRLDRIEGTMMHREGD